MLAVMNATKRKQLRDLIKRGFAREIPEQEIKKWLEAGGKVYYMPHQMAPNPSSKSTPVRVVFNNALLYKGDSLNSNLDQRNQ